MKFLEDLKNINPRDPGGWPWPIKISAFSGIFLAVIAAGAALDWAGQWEALKVEQDKEVVLKNDFEAKKGIAINLDIIKKKLTETKQSFDSLLKQLPSKSEMDALLTDINQAGLGRGLQFELFRPGAEIITGVFAERPIALKVTGNYDDIGKFASDIGQLPRIVSLTDISIANVTGGQLAMDATARTYRYLDEEELVAQKKAAKAAADKAKPGANPQAAATGHGADK